MHSGDIPETIGHYRIVSLLGEDAHGVIYQAVAQDTEQTVALKVLPAEAFPSSEVRQQFLAEARAQAQVTH
ncbi:MAG: serine/threonine protein kinase, partial [Candidatus Acidiferrales bacterium]